VVDVALTGEAANASPGSFRMPAPGTVDVAAGDEWLRLRGLRADGHAVALVTLLDADRLEDGA